MHENEGGRAHSDAYKISERPDLDRLRISIERRMV